jgi:hypothetical protein
MRGCRAKRLILQGNCRQLPLGVSLGQGLTIAMTDFLATYHLQGLVLGLCSFLIIGICHPIVIKGEYHYGQPFKWVFLLAGVLLCIGSLLVDNVLLSALMGVGAFSCFWGIKEMRDQQERVRKGWFPRNPKRTYPWDEKNDELKN